MHKIIVQLIEGRKIEILHFLDKKIQITEIPPKSTGDLTKISENTPFSKFN